MLGGTGCSQGGVSLDSHASIRIGERAKQRRGRLFWRHCAGLAAAGLGVWRAGLRAHAVPLEVLAALAQLGMCICGRWAMSRLCGIAGRVESAHAPS